MMNTWTMENLNATDKDERLYAMIERIKLININPADAATGIIKLTLTLSLISGNIAKIHNAATAISTTTKA